MVTNPNRIARPVIAPDQLISLDDVRVKLSRVWLIGSGLIFILLVLQCLLHVYDPVTQDVWSWFLPTIMPSLGLIITVLTYTAFEPRLTGSVVRRSFVPVALWLSVFYLSIVALTILVQPFAAKTAADRIGLMKTSNLWLGPMQGLVASALGVLFVSKQKAKEG